jgi:hypothetical protein
MEVQKKHMQKWLNYNLSQFIQNNVFKNYDVNYSKKNIKTLNFQCNFEKTQLTGSWLSLASFARIPSCPFNENA